ncbi:hypothetical protein [Bacillus sp. FJAT-22090]|uniref:hypothetical protein n=1 Tax=Bacillus sp. FJAT-22090 TaxID=1581038 RepID=UPI0016435C3C|nr:hypothetical protein [Bacillus sp. FJAT-22090]
MITNPIARHKWWNIGAAAFLSVDILATCGNNQDDNDDGVKGNDIDKEEVEDTEKK